MNITLITVGKLDQNLLSMRNEYIKMSSWPINVIQLPHSKNSNIAEIKRLEGSKILAKIPAKSYVILLDQLGKNFSSEQLSSHLENLDVYSRDIAIIIGGAYGVSGEVKTKADLCLSLSSMTLTHQFAQLFILEQIYRAQTIINNHPYHK